MIKSFYAHFFLLFIVLLGTHDFSYAQSWDWLTIGGGVKSDKATTIVVSDDGYSYVTGYYNEEANFGPINTGFSFQSSKEVFVAKMDPDGNYIWVKNGLNFFDDRGLGLCIDDLGNVYVTGTCWGGLEFGALSEYNSTSYTDQIFVVKLDSDGNEQWMKNAGVDAGGYPYNDDHGQDLATDSEGNIIITGFISNNTDDIENALFDAISIPIAPNDSLAFVGKLSGEGEWMWIETFDGIWEHRDNSVCVDDENNIYVTGGFVETGNFGSTTLTSYGKEDIYVVKYDTDGNFVFAVQAGDTLDDRGDCITYGNDDHVYITGEFRGNNAQFGSNFINNYGGGPEDRDIFVARLTKNGEWDWVRKAGSKKGKDRGIGICANDQGNIFVTGQYRDKAKFGELELDAGQDSVQLFVAAIDTNGIWRWALDGGGPDFDRGADVACDTACNVYVTGYFSLDLTLGESTETAQGKDIYTAKIKDGCFGYAPPQPPTPPIEEDDCTILENNVFSPNNDQINDQFIFSTSCNAEIEITVLNRWGDVVYQSTNPLTGWDGTDNNGNHVSDGTYFYHIDITHISGIEETKSGFITLVR